MAGVGVTRKIKTALMWVFLVFSLATVAWFKLSQPRILVLHSYAPDYSWTRDIDIGLKRVLDAKLGYKVQWHYMDTKNHPDKESKVKAGMLARRSIDALKPNLIIAIDDDAQIYAAKQYAGDPNISILFAGINGLVEPYGYHKVSNVTGIYERRPLLDLRRALLDMRGPEGLGLGHQILHLGDRSESVQADLAEIEIFDWKPFKIVESILVDTFDDWKQAVRGVKGKTNLILVSNYRNIYATAARKKLVSPGEIIKWTEENASVPVVGIGGYMVEDGGMFAIGVSGYEQGETAARMAIQVLDHDAVPKSIPEVMPRQFLVYVRRSLMAKRELVLPQVYEAFARASNNYYE